MPRHRQKRVPEKKAAGITLLSITKKNKVRAQSICIDHNSYENYKDKKILR
jgi:hypothetical protein